MAEKWVESLVLALLLLGSGRIGWLSRSGVLGALVLGLVFIWFDEQYFLLGILFFFVSSSLISEYKKKEKQAKLHGISEKGERRDFLQTLANGGIPVFIAILYHYRPSVQYFSAYFGSLSAVVADTWGTEIGTLGKGEPRMLFSRKKVEAGVSGGVTLVGLLGGVLGSALLGVVAFVVVRLFGPHYVAPQKFGWVSLCVLCGLLGTLFDSFLGEFFQERFYCSQCRKETEQAIHSCGTPTARIKGSRFIKNDAVNFLTSLLGAYCGYFL